MDEFISSYREIEEGIGWASDSARTDNVDRADQIIEDLRKNVRDRSLSEKIEPPLYERRLYELVKFVLDLRQALGQHSYDSTNQIDKKTPIWHHRSIYQMSRGIKKDDEPEIDRGLLLEVATYYLANPWLQHDQVDWIFIDALIFAEVSAYRESVFSGEATGNLNWGYIVSGGDAQKAFWFQVKKTFGIFSIRYIVPPILIFGLYYFSYEMASVITGLVYAAYLLLRVGLWPLRYRKRRAEEKALEEHVIRLTNMIDTYRYCAPPVVSLSALQRFLYKAVDSGAIFDGALFSLLKRVEGTRGEALIPFVKGTRGM